MREVFPGHYVACHFPLHTGLDPGPETVTALPSTAGGNGRGAHNGNGRGNGVGGGGSLDDRALDDTGPG
jgi:hypothetical protein